MQVGKQFPSVFRSILATDSIPSWNRAFVRYLDDDGKWKPEYRDLIKAPFDTSNSDGGDRLPVQWPPGKWVFIAGLTNQPWFPLISNAADGMALFQASAKRKPLENCCCRARRPG